MGRWIDQCSNVTFMPLPGNVSTGTVTGTLTRLDGSPSVGVASFKPTPRYLLDAGANVILTSMPPITDVLDGTGSFSVVLPATNDTDLNPVDWTYDVYLELEDEPNISFAMYVPAGVTTDIADVAPVSPAAGTALGRNASDVFVVDAANQFTATNAETALAEIGSEINSIWLNANQMMVAFGAPSTTAFGGATSLFSVWLLDQSLDEAIAGNVWIPSAWVTFAVDLYWTNQGAGVGNVKFVMNHYHVGASGEDLRTVDRSVLPPAIPAPLVGILNVTTIDTAVPSLGGGHRAFFLRRNGTDVADTLPNDAAVIGLMIRRLT